MDGRDLLAALSATLLAGIVGFSLRRRPGRSVARQVRLGLLVLIGGLVGYLLYGAGWIRPEMWLLAEPGTLVQRLSAAGLSFLFGLASLALERPVGRRNR